MADRRANSLRPRRPGGTPPPGRRRTSARVRRNRAVLGSAVVTIALVAGVLVVATRSGNGRSVAAGPATSVDRPPPAPPTCEAARTATRRGNDQAVTLAFGGDVHFEGRIRAALDTDPSSVLAGVAPLLRAADLAAVNLETAVTDRGTKAEGKQYTFRAPPSAFSALKAAGVDVATMANNHGLDYGSEGLEDSLAAAATADVPLIGIGRSAADAYRPFVTVVKGQRIAILGATQVLDGNLETAWTAVGDHPGLASAKAVTRLTDAVCAARGQADTVVVFLHWGTEEATCPNEAQPDLAQVLVDAGADVIVGTHAHRLQGAGRLGPAFVAYGLGNLAFYQDSGPATESGILTLTVTGRDVDQFRWAPAQLVGQLPQLLRGAAAVQARAAWSDLRGCAQLSD